MLPRPDHQIANEEHAEAAFAQEVVVAAVAAEAEKTRLDVPDIFRRPISSLTQYAGGRLS
jgi:hypothetical protein